MIEKNEIIKLATALELSPDTVEKDYVLGWMLYGINHHETASKWVFKGGTSLKKCFFETFRFSEDLDFTVTSSAELTEESLLTVFSEITSSLEEVVGIEFHKDKFNFKIIPKRDGHIYAQGKIHYNGPLRRKHGTATIKLDLTSDELLVLKAKNKQSHHPYSDEPPDGIYANCYAFEEVIAEKIRALGERARPRDLYDVVHFFRNRESIKNPGLVYQVLEKKCAYKGIEIPTFESVESHEKIDELEQQWENMLSHQLSHLPPMGSFWSELPLFFEWLLNQLQVEHVEVDYAEGQPLYIPGRTYTGFTIDPILQKIQFAASNRLCIELVYSSKARTVEPLSFRTANSGNKLFYGFERNAGHIKNYSITKIESVKVTNQTYVEKYPVEMSSTGIISMPPIRRNHTSLLSGSVFSMPRKRTSKRSSGIGTFRSYTESKHHYKCDFCGKKFSRKRQNSVLKPHKNKDGWPCSGRHGYYLGYY